MENDIDPKTLSQIEAVEQRVTRLYANPRIASLFMTDFVRKAETERNEFPEDAPSAVHRVRMAAEAFGLGALCRYYHVESDYYEWPLEKRAMRLNAPTTSNLCKSVLFENTRWQGNPETDDIFDVRNAKYYLVIVQYTDKLNTTKLNTFVWDTLGGKSVSKKQVNLRVADEDVAESLTGFGRNGVSPIGMACGDTKMPVIITKNAAEAVPPVVFLGAGHVDWKIAVPVHEFVAKRNCFVTDLS